MKYLKLFENHWQYVGFVLGGTIMKPNVSHCINENEVHYNPKTIADEYLTFIALEDGTFTFTPQNFNVIAYSTNNGNTWTEGNSVDANSGDRVLWKGTMTPAQSYGIGTFSSTANFDVRGNAMSLLYGDNFSAQESLSGKNYSFARLFSGNTNVIDAEKLLLPATTLAAACYYCMFRGCTSLTSAPKLPATTLATNCYGSMFNGCASLTAAPALPATTLANSCYSEMFNGCAGLTAAPELPATTLADLCYYSMFQGCTSITTAPELPATTLTTGCYEIMFQGCTGLVTAPELPATTLTASCYTYMFGGCTSLTTAPELPAITLAESCYTYMFAGCASLNYIKAMFTTAPAGTYMNNWVSGVSNTGTFIKNSAATWQNTFGSSAIPKSNTYKWTVETATAS